MGLRVVISILFIINAIVIAIIQNIDSVLLGVTFGALLWSVIDFIGEKSSKGKKVQGLNSIISGGISGGAVFGVIPMIPLTFVPLFFGIGFFVGFFGAIVVDILT